MIRIFENKPILQFKESELLNLFGNGANPYYAKVADALASFNGWTWQNYKMEFGIMHHHMLKN